MATHHVVFQAQLTAGELTLDALTVAAPARLTAIGTPKAYTIEIPEADGVDVRIKGFSAGGQAYAITVISHVAGRADATWTTAAADAVSPAFTLAGDYLLDVTAATGIPGATRKLSSVSMKIKPSGKPDDFLTSFKPQ